MEEPLFPWCLEGQVDFSASFLVTVWLYFDKCADSKMFWNSVVYSNSSNPLLHVIRTDTILQRGKLSVEQQGQACQEQLL